MTEVTLASLAMDFDVRSAAPATQQTDQLRASTRALEEQAKATAAAMRDHAVSQGLSGTAAGKAVQAMAPLVGVWGQARDALGRFTAADGAFRMSQDLTAKMLLQNANAATAYARQQEQAAKVVAKAEADAAREAQAAWKQSQAIQAEIMRERVQLARAAEREEAQAAKAAQKAIEDADRAAERSAQQVTSFRMRMARQRAAEEASAAQEEARAVQQVIAAQEKAAATTASYAAKVAGLKAQLDPFAAVQNTLAQRTKLLDEAMAHGAITADQHAAALSQVTRAAASDVVALDRLQKAHGGAGEAARLQSYQLLNLGRNGADVFVQLASGQGIMMTLIQQGPQIAEVFAEAATQGVGFKAALAGIAAQIAPFLPLIAILGATAAALGLVAVGVKRNLDNEQALRSFTGQLALNVDGLNYNAQALANTSKELSKYGLSAKDASAGLSTFVNAGVDTDKLKAYSVAAKSLSEVSTQFKDVKSAQEATAKAFTGGLDDVLALNQQLNFLTVKQYESIKAKYEDGRASEAQAEAFEDYSRRVIDAANKTRSEWDEVTRDMGAAWNGFLDRLADTDAIRGAEVVLKGLMGVVTDVLNLGKDKPQGADSSVASTVQRGLGQYLGYLVPVIGAANALSSLGSRDRALHPDAVKPTQGALAPTDSRAAIAAANEHANSWSKIAANVSLATQEIERYRKGQADIRAANPNSKELDSPTQAAAIEAAIRKRYEHLKDGPSAATVATRAARLDDTTQDALDRAQKAELAAQQALTQNIDMLAGYRKQQVEQEAEAARANVDREVAAKKLNGTLAPAIKAAIDRAAALKTQAIDQQLFSDQLARQRAVEDTIAGYTDRQAQSQAALATSLEQAQAIENKAIADQQQRAAARREFDLFMDWADGKKTEAEVRQINEAASATDIGAKAVKAQEDRLAIFQRDLDLARQASQNEADILSSRQGLAQSAYEAGQIERRIMAVRYQAERAEKVKIAENTALDADVRASALARIPVLDEIYRNELRQLELSNNAVTAYADLVGALSNAARAVVDGDIGGSISAAGGVLRQLSGLAKGSALSGALATAASYAGPIGAAVSAVTGVLGAIGDRSAAKAQAKLDRLTKAVEDLRTDNKTSSGSITAALSEANANWNSDLEYSSAMLSALRSIDAKTGAAAALLARQVSTGGLLGTDGLGLGSSSSQGSFGTGLGAAGLTGAALAGGTSLLMGGFAGALALGPMGLVAGAVGALVGALTKTKTTVDVLDQGLTFAASTFDQITKNGVTGSSYADLVTTTKKSLLGVGLSTKVKTSTVTGGVDSDLLGQISGVIQALGDGVLASASVFGIEAAKAAEGALGSAVVDLGKLSLKDLKPDEIADVLNATFDKVGDQLAAAGVPGLDKLASVGEGAFETLTRVAREYEVVDASLAAIGKTFGQVGLESIAARDNLVQLFGGLDAFTSQTSFFATNFLTDAEKLAPVIRAVNDNLKDFGLSAESSRDQFKNLVLAQDLTTEAGRNTYAALLAVAPAFDKVATSAETAAKAATDAAIANQATNIGLMRQLQAMDDAVLGTNVAVLAQREDELAKLDDTGKALQKLIWAREDDAAQVEKNAKLLEDQRAKDAEYAQARDSAISAAKNALSQAYEREKSAMEASRSKLVDLVKTLRDFSSSISADVLSALDPNTQLQVAAKAFNDNLNPDLIPQLGEAYKKAAEGAAVTQLDYLRNLASIKRTSDKAADTAQQQVTVADRQLEALNALVSGYLDINESTLSVVDAIEGLRKAMALPGDAKAAGGAAAGGGAANAFESSLSSLKYDGKPIAYNDPNYGEALKSSLDAQAMANRALGFNAWNAAQIAQGVTWRTERDYRAVAGLDLNTGLPMFAGGGAFTIAGNAGLDNNLMSINGQPAAWVNQGETVNITPAGRAANDSAPKIDLQRLEALMAKCSGDQAAMKELVAQMLDLWRRVTRDGDAVVTEAA